LAPQETQKQQLDDGLTPQALQDAFFMQPAVLVGLIAQLTGLSLQDDIAMTARRLQQLGHDILCGSTQHLGGIHSPFAQSISTILNFKQLMDSFFRDKSKICVLERSNEAILTHKLGLKYTRFVNSIRVGMFWTKHSLQPHEISISITNVYSID
jgi:hypothetical protein